MKIMLINGVGTINSLVDHCENVTNKMEGADICLLEQPLLEYPKHLPVLNSNIGVMNYMLNDELRNAVLQNVVKVSGEPFESELFAIFNGENFSDFIEVSYSTKFMTYNIGPCVGFTCGTAIKVTTPIEEAIPQMKDLLNFLREIKYHGEISIGLSSNYCITGFAFQHFYGHFSMFCEMAVISPSEILSFMIGEQKSCDLHDTCCVANLISKQPFPVPISSRVSPRIAAPKGAEKHLWRLPLGFAEPVIVTTHGSFLKEAQKRLQRTIYNMLSYDSDIQYRTDYGQQNKFVLCKDKYDIFKTNPFWKKEESKPSLVPELSNA